MWSRMEQERRRSGTSSAALSWQAIKGPIPQSSVGEFYEVSTRARSAEAAQSELKDALIILSNPETTHGLVRNLPDCSDTHCESYLAVEVMDPPTAAR
jgi:hypothetical protein